MFPSATTGSISVNSLKKTETLLSSYIGIFYSNTLCWLTIWLPFSLLFGRVDHDADCQCKPNALVDAMAQILRWHSFWNPFALLNPL